MNGLPSMITTLLEWSGLDRRLYDPDEVAGALEDWRERDRGLSALLADRRDTVPLVEPPAPWPR